MKANIRAHVENLFSSAPATHRARELKEEIIANLSERYDDLIAQGMDEDGAYRTALNGIGDVDELIEALREQHVLSPILELQQRRRSALLVSTAVALYIISPVFPAVLRNFYGFQGLSIILLFLCCSVATGLLVYNYASKPKYIRQDETLVENFKEWKHTKNKQAALRSSINSLVWSLALIVFFLLGFFAHAWSVAWLVFIVAVAVNQVVKLVFTYKEGMEE